MRFKDLWFQKFEEAESLGHQGDEAVKYADIAATDAFSDLVDRARELAKDQKLEQLEQAEKLV